MRLYPRIPDQSEVKKYFQKMANGKNQFGYGQAMVKLVTPTAMAEEQARAKLGQGKRKQSKAPVRKRMQPQKGTRGSKVQRKRKARKALYK